MWKIYRCGKTRHVQLLYARSWKNPRMKVLAVGSSFRCCHGCSSSTEPASASWTGVWSNQHICQVMLQKQAYICVPPCWVCRVRILRPQPWDMFSTLICRSLPRYIQDEVHLVWSFCVFRDRQSLNDKCQHGCETVQAASTKIKRKHQQ